MMIISMPLVGVCRRQSQIRRGQDSKDVCLDTGNQNFEHKNRYGRNWCATAAENHRGKHRDQNLSDSRIQKQSKRQTQDAGQLTKNLEYTNEKVDGIPGLVSKVMLQMPFAALLSDRQHLNN